MDKVFGFLAFAVGIYVALGICFPRSRGNWKGSSVPAGAVSYAGIAVVLISFGIMWVWSDKVSERYRAWLALPIILGALLAIVGHALDSWKYARTSGTTAEPLVSPNRRWLLIALGTLLFILLMKTTFFR